MEPPPIFSKSLTGRYGRLNFANAHAAITGIFLLLMVIHALLQYFVTVRIPFIISLFLIVAWVVYSARAHSLRLHDMNVSEWFYAPIFITPLVLQIGFNMPLVAMLFQFGVLVLMLIIPGTSSKNRFGIPSRQGKPYGLIILLIIFILSILLIILGLLWLELGFGLGTDMIK